MTDSPVAVVTGASRGIGASVASMLAASGYHVIVNHRNSGAHAEAVVNEIRSSGGSAEVVQADVTDLDQARTLVSYVKSKHGRLDALVNNAGRADDGFLLLTQDRLWWATFLDNLSPVVNCTRAALPLMLKGHAGSIVNISSVSGIRGTEGQTAYSAAKAAIIGFTKSIAREVATKGISVNCVAPGPIDTELYRSASETRRDARLTSLPMGRLGDPTEVAEVVVFLAERRSPFVHGAVIVVDGGLL